MKKLISMFLTLTLICCAVPFTALAAETTDLKQIRNELEILEFRANECMNNMGDTMPHTYSSFERLQKGIDFADKVLDAPEATVEQYQEAIDILEYAFNNPTLEIYYIKENYVLSTFEHNENGFYYEEDWNDFSAKRDALRDSFKTNDEEIINDAFFALHESFVNMTSKYTLAGDVNNDGKVDIDDVTLVQKYIAGMENLTELQKEFACAYYGISYVYYETPEPTIDDVTSLQKCVAGLINAYSSPYRYGYTYRDRFGVTYNTKITMSVFLMPGDDLYDYVDAKVAELEAEGII